jgi:EmrB/QacA subfamily drug resistance transporter
MDAEKITPASRETVLVIVTIASFLNPFTGSAINLALPLIAGEFHTDAITLGWIPSAYLLASVVCLLPAGRAGDLYGRVLVFKAGAIVYTAASVLAIFTPSMPVLIALRICQGIGSSMIFANSVAIITDLYPPGERGYALGINVTAIYAGLSTGPFLGGIIAQFWGWRSIFLVTVLLGMVVIATFRRMPASCGERRFGTFDFAGMILSTTAIASLFFSLTSITQAIGYLSLVVAAIFSVLFFIVEGRQPSPLVPIPLLRENVLFLYSNLAALINYSATFAISFLLSLYLQFIRGLEPASAGLLLLAQPVMQVICSPIAGRLSDRAPAATVASVGMLATAASLLGLATVDPSTSFLTIGLLLTILGAGLAFFSAPNTNVVMSCVGRELYGCASALLATMRNVGMIVSMGITMLVFSFLLGTTVVTPEVYPSLLRAIQLIFLVFFLLTLIGAALSWHRSRMVLR